MAMAVEIWKNYFDVVVLPSPVVAEYAVQLSRRLQRHGAEFVLGPRSYIPHISLYHIPVLPKDFRNFSDAVTALAASHSGGELQLTALEMPVIQTDKPLWLRSLHRDVVRSTVRYFDWDYGAQERWHTDYLPARLKARAEENVRKYGSPLIGGVFRPHITLTSFTDKTVVSEIPEFEIEPLRFEVKKIAICEMGPHHSCQRVVKTFRLNVGAS
jgi:hypothetical protein